MSSQSTPPDPKRRSFLRILIDPEAAAEFGRQAGRAWRELRDALDPPAVSVERYEAMSVQVEQLQTKVEQLRAANEAKQAQIEQLQAANEAKQAQIEMLFREGAERDRQIMDAIQELRDSRSPRDHAELEKWRNLRGLLWAALSGVIALAGKETASALYQAWVQDEMYSQVKDLVELVLRPRDVAVAAPSSQPQPPDADLEAFEPARPSQPEQWNALAPEMVYIPPGWFWMGSDRRRDPQANDDETPMHQVYLGGYWIGRFAVTVAQFAAFVEATGFRTSAETEGGAFAFTGLGWSWVEGANWRHPRGPQSDVRQKQDHPVTCLQWRDAQRYCEWLTEVTGRRYRLPSEAEWEKAARGTDGRIYPWGNEQPTPRHCNFDMNVGDTTPVGSYPMGESPYGVFDMAGNVWEWTNSLWKGYPYDPDDGREDSHSQGARIVRGGSFYNHDRYVRCAVRDRLYPISRNDSRGFRVVSPGS